MTDVIRVHSFAREDDWPWYLRGLLMASVVLPLAIFCVYGYHSWQHAQDSTVEDARRIAAMAVEHVSWDLGQAGYAADEVPLPEPLRLHFQKVFRALVDGNPQATVTLLSQGGLVLAHVPRDALAVADVWAADAPLLRKMEQSGAITDPGPADGVRRIHAVQPVPGLGLRVVVGLGWAEMASAWLASLLVEGAVALGAAATLAALTLEVADRGQRRLREQRTLEREVALRSAEARGHAEFLELALNAADMSSYDYHVASGVVRRSENARRLHGLPTKTRSGLGHVLRRVHPDDRRRMRQELEQVLRDGGQYRLQYRLMRPQGGWFWASDIGRVIPGADGVPERVTGVLMDITTHKLAELETSRALAEQDRARQAAERADRAKSRFLAAASHDLRQPMQALRLYLDALAVRLSDPVAQAILDKAQVAMASGEGLLSALLDVSTLDAGMVQPSPRTLPLGEMLSDLLADCGPDAAAKGLSLRVVDTGLHTCSDPVLLRRILRNLVVNAIRYTDQGGVLVGCRRMGNSVRVEVWDTGCGIPQDKQDAIFEEFYQLGNPSRDRAQGLGLGLSIVQRTAALLGHPVSVRSQPGRGSVFAIALPLVSAEAAADAAA